MINIICIANTPASPDLWSGLWSNTIGALIGGLIAFAITLSTIYVQKKQQSKQEKKINEEKEVQLLWQIFLDIKRDFESLKLWDKYLIILEHQVEPNGSPTARYVSEFLATTISDLRSFMNLLLIKDREGSEYLLLWERAGYLLALMGKIVSLNIAYKGGMKDAYNEYKLAHEIFLNHTKRLEAKKKSC